MNAFNILPSNAKIWIYTAERPITLEEHEYICARMGNFIDDWKAHGTKLNAAFALLHKRFIVIAVDEEGQNATGCSIDTCVHEIQDMSTKLNIDFFNRLNIVFRDEDLVVSTSANTFKQMIAEGDITEKTVVFDNTIQSLADLRTRWEVPAGQTWMKRFFKTTHV
jgi:hypothetical protein